MISGEGWGTKVCGRINEESTRVTSFVNSRERRMTKKMQRFTWENSKEEKNHEK